MNKNFALCDAQNNTKFTKTHHHGTENGQHHHLW
jgi:hypothetical protein